MLQTAQAVAPTAAEKGFGTDIAGKVETTGSTRLSHCTCLGVLGMVRTAEAQKLRKAAIAWFAVVARGR